MCDYYVTAFDAPCPYLHMIRERGRKKKQKKKTSNIKTVVASFMCNQYFITNTRLFKYIENFISKTWKFSDKKNSDIFHISAQNIDCGYSIEPPRRGGSNEYPQSMF